MLSEPRRGPAGRLRRLAAWPRWLVSPAAHRHNRAWLAATRSALAARRRRDAARLTVGVDVNALYETITGVGAALLGLLGALADRDDVALRLYGQDLVDAPEALRPIAAPAGRALEWVRYPPAWLPGGHARLARRLVSLDRNDVLFLPNYLFPAIFPRRHPAAVVHVLDLTIRRYPELVRPDTRRALEAGLERSIRRARFVLTPCEAVRAEVIETFAPLGLDPERVVAVHLAAPLRPAPSPEALAEPCPGLRAGEPFALAVATLDPRKNLGLLLAAFRRLRERLPHARLVLAGGAGWAGADLAAAVQRAVSEGWLLRPGFVDDERLAALYARARLIAFPSLYEGFGFPVLEAFAAGTPLVASDIPTLREIAGAGAMLVAPGDEGAWAAGLERLWTDESLRQRAIEAGRARLRDFDWRRTAEATVDLWRRAHREAGARRDASSPQGRSRRAV